jgi:ABC-type sugar transport system ATPase subunit
MRQIQKKFPGIVALDKVDFTLYPGEVHALVGENGAGKSTLIKVLSGIYPKDGGKILINNNPVDIIDVNHARKLGISIIHQELVLVPRLNVMENIFIGREPIKNGLVDFGLMKQQTTKILADMKLNINPNKMILELSIAQQQMVEIVKAISFNSKIIVMDEPTSSITNKDIENLFENIRRLTHKRIGIIYISHRLGELQEIADRVTVLRDGKLVAVKKIEETDNNELIALMVGRSIENYYIRTYNDSSEIVLHVENINTESVHDINFELKKGEILGFAGLIGAGRTEVAKALMGLDKIGSGKILLMGQVLSHKTSVYDRIKKGIVLVPEDRKTEGLFPIQSLRFNLTLKVIYKFIRGVINNTAMEKAIADEGMQQLYIRAVNDLTAIGLLSGGNQQKAIIASWLTTSPKILILDEPTRGIDVGAKREIYKIMNTLAASGVAIIMISSELTEIINMSDRVVVMRNGRIQAVLDRSMINQETIMQYAVEI